MAPETTTLPLTPAELRELREAAEVRLRVAQANARETGTPVTANLAYWQGQAALLGALVGKLRAAEEAAGGPAR